MAIQCQRPARDAVAGASAVPCPLVAHTPKEPLPLPDPRLERSSCRASQARETCNGHPGDVRRSSGNRRRSAGASRSVVTNDADLIAARMAGDWVIAVERPAKRCLVELCGQRGVTVMGQRSSQLALVDPAKR